MTHGFLTDDWLDAVERLQSALPDPPARLARTSLNIKVDGAPGDGELQITGGRFARGSSDDALATITMSYGAAKAMLVDKDQSAAMQAFTSGEITVDGDINALMSLQPEPTPELTEVAAKIKKLTADIDHVDVGNTPPKTSREIVFDEIARLDLEHNVLELEQNGFTVVENALPLEMMERMREVILDQVADKTGGPRPDIDTWDGGVVREGSYLLYEDPIFEQVVQNEYVIALMQYLLGRSMVLSTVYSHVRANGDPGLPLHTDQWTLELTDPVQVAVANFALVDYERDKGAFAVVPGSNHLMRRPRGPETDVYDNPDCIPLEMKAGSVVVTAGNTWHGAYRRKEPGLRVNCAVVYCRHFIQTQERIREGVTQEMLDRNPERFRELVGLNSYLGFGREGPDFTKFKAIETRFD